jgi:hypothetical protein
MKTQIKAQTKKLTLTVKDELKNVKGGVELEPELEFGADQKQSGPR